MCSRCTKHKRYWLHIVDQWTEEEKKEMIDHLQSNNQLALYSIGIGKK